VSLAAIDPRAVARDTLAALLRHRIHVEQKLAPAAVPDHDGALQALRETKLEWATLLDGSKAAEALALRAFGRGVQATRFDEDDAARLVDGSELGLTLQALVVFAQRGRAWDWGADATMAGEAVTEVCGLLWPLSAALPLDDARGDLGVALRAVWTRVQLAGGSPVAQRWLADVAGVSDGRVRQEIAAGALKRVRAAKGVRSADRGWITAASAKAWLAARGVAGFEATGE